MVRLMPSGLRDLSDPKDIIANPTRSFVIIAMRVPASTFLTQLFIEPAIANGLGKIRVK